MPYQHLSRENRFELSALMKAGISLRACARQLGFSPAAIKKEVDRNGGRDNYRPRFAQRRYLRLRKGANQCHRILGKDLAITQKVLELLADEWTPEQIAGRMMLEWGYQLASPTSIYNYINPRPELHYLLARKCNKYRRTKAGNERKKAREQKDLKRSIDERPEVANQRKRIGDWEGDTIIGKERTARILTVTERASGFLLADLLEKVSAESIRRSSVELFKCIPPTKKHTITYDNGTEFADHELIEKQTQLTAYFAHPYHSWERGTNENTNGLIRRYFPKGTVFSKIDMSYFKFIIKKLNHRPRKRLGYRTPFEVFHGVNFRTLI
jgi:IS30 family transposase